VEEKGGRKINEELLMLRNTNRNKILTAGREGIVGKREIRGMC